MGAESETDRAAPKRPRKTLLLALGAGVLALAGSLAFLERNRLFPAPKVDVPRRGSGTPLLLTVEAQGAGLNIRWNPESEPVANAREGRLVIKEGDQKVQTLLFDPQQLKTGYVNYESTAERLEFQMEVVDAAGVIAEASVTALPSRTATAQVVEPPPATGTEVAGRLERQAGCVITLEPPANLPNNLTSPRVSLTPAASSLAGLRVQGPPPSQPIQSRPIPSQPIKVGGNLQAGKLVKKVLPVYPEFAKSAHLQGTVRFTALIAKDGTIQNLQLISGPPMLIQAATEAVKQWLYRPTLLNGEPVEVITQIDVNFTR